MTNNERYVGLLTGQLADCQTEINTQNARIALLKRKLLLYLPGYYPKGTVLKAMRPMLPIDNIGTRIEVLSQNSVPEDNTGLVIETHFFYWLDDDEAMTTTMGRTEHTTEPLTLPNYRVVPHPEEVHGD